MDKHKIIVYFLLVLIVIILLFNTCGKSPNDHLNKALLHLDTAQKRLDTALAKIDSSKKIIDSMRVDLSAFQQQINSVHTGVQELNLNSRNNEQLCRSSLNDIKSRNQKLLEQLKVHRDTLPEIKIQ